MKILGQGSVASWLKLVLDIVWWLLWIAGGLLGAWALLYAGMLTGLAAGWISPAWEAGHVQILVPGARAIHATHEDFAWTVAAPALLGAAFAIGGGLVVVQRLKRLFANFCSEKPFLMENAHHLRVIWIALLVLELSRYAVVAMIGLAMTVFGQPEAHHVSVSLSVRLESWFAIFTLMVLAEVFRVGARMREEQDLTI